MGVMQYHLLFIEPDTFIKVREKHNLNDMVKLEKEIEKLKNQVKGYKSYFSYVKKELKTK